MPVPPGEMKPHAPDVLRALRDRGVRIPAPEQVYIGREVSPENIAPGAELRPFSRLTGASTRIDAGAVIGAAGAASLHDSWVGENARIGTLGPVVLEDVSAGPGTVLGAGVAEQAVFLGKEVTDPDFTTGFGFRVRKGSLYEEDANSAQHTDTKMTILLPWTTLGSNINFCDVLLAGGTGPGPGAFSEIGSGVIHFNFTPRGDKATGSLLGDATRGVFLRERRLFIGGNASLIGPLRAEYGAVTTAGGRFQRSLTEGLNVPESEAPHPSGSAFDADVYGSILRLVVSQVRMIGELAALDAWYREVRAVLAAGDAARTALYARGQQVVEANLVERISRLGELARRMERSAGLLERQSPGDARIAQQREFLQHWPRMEAHLGTWAHHRAPPPQRLLEALQSAAADGAGNVGHGFAYTRIVRALPEPVVSEGNRWLAGIAQATAPEALWAPIPDISPSR